MNSKFIKINNEFLATIFSNSLLKWTYQHNFLIQFRVHCHKRALKINNKNGGYYLCQSKVQLLKIFRFAQNCRKCRATSSSKAKMLDEVLCNKKKKKLFKFKSDRSDAFTCLISINNPLWHSTSLTPISSRNKWNSAAERKKFSFINIFCLLI